ncbi:acyl-CoA thioesterase [Streptomyces sp. NPDC048254]|uniref:acyl-CoA thioesterase n=1 Tax=Streptomyces sp. NPDC048254 TaxID=3365525 RepID=UPI003724C542
MHQEPALLELLGLLDPTPAPGRDDAEHGALEEHREHREHEECFLGRPPQERTSPVYGGLVAAQALAAAGRTVPDGLPVHAVHCSFVRPGLPTASFDHRVDRVKTTPSFATRRVRTIQRGREVFALTASFHRPEPGLAHQEPMPAVPDPEDLPTYEERLTKAFGEAVAPLGKPYETRFVGPLSFDAEQDPALVSSRTRVWVRIRGEAPGGGEPLLHACLLVYVCDVTMLETVAVRHGVSWFHATARSLDYTVWIHRPFRADDWLLCAHETPVAAGGRGLVLGRVFTRDGVLVATLAQEGLLRVSGDRAEAG